MDEGVVEGGEDVRNSEHILSLADLNLTKGSIKILSGPNNNRPEPKIKVLPKITRFDGIIRYLNLGSQKLPIVGTNNSYYY